MKKRIISLLFAVLMLISILTVFAFAEKYDSAGYSVTTFEQLEDYIEDLDDHYILDLTILNDIEFEDVIEIEAEDVDIYLHGPASLLLPGKEGFYVDDDHVSLYFDNITIKGTDSYPGDGQGIYVSGYGDNCLISGARFENCGWYKSYGFDWSGGAIDVDGENCTIENCDFIGCKAGTDGGGVYIDEEGCVVSNCYFENCYAGGSGGAIYVCYEQTDAQINNCKFVNCGKNNAIGKNVFAMGYAAVTDPHPYSTDEKLYYDCTLVYTGEAFRPVNVVDIPDGDYMIISALDSNKCLDIAGGKDAKSNGDNLHIWSRESATGSVFTVRKDAKTGAYSIQPKHSGLELSVKDNTPESGATIIQWEDYGNLGQRWIFEDAGDGYVCIRSLFGKYVDVFASGTEDGTDVISFRYLGTDGQRFMLEQSVPQSVGSVLSEGSLWIIISVAVLAIGGVATLVIVKKKKKHALAGGTDNTDEE